VSSDFALDLNENNRKTPHRNTSRLRLLTTVVMIHNVAC
jgi:hypothetical protein